MVMPTLHPCPCSPTCRELLPRGVARCRQGARIQERTRYNADVRHWYHTSRWKGLRQDVIRSAENRCAEPTCRLVTLDLDVDHVVPHEGNEARFFDRNNLQALCRTCHAKKTRRGQ